MMLVFGARVAAGAGSCAGGGAPFGVVVVCGCTLVAVLAGGVAPVCGSGCGRWWVLSWREVCGVSRGGAGGVGCGVGGARLRSCVGGLWCPVPPGGGGGCGAVWWCCAVWWPSCLGGGGHRVQVWWGRLSPVVCPLAVWGSLAWSLDRPPGVFQYVGRAGSVWRGALGPLGRAVRDWSVATRGVWSCGAWGCRPTVEWAQWCGVLRLRGPRVGGSRLPGRVVAPVRCPRVVSGGVWLGCIVSTVGGGAICSGVGWARGRLPAGSGCRGLTVGGYSAVSPWWVPWWSLVGWLKGVFGVYRIHGGTIVCWGAAAVGAAGCGGGACVGVDRVVGSGVSCVVLGGSSWWSVVVVPWGWSLALRFLGGCGTCGVGLAWGGGAHVWACVFAFCSPRGPFLCLSLTPLFSLACLALFFFFRGGRLGCCAWVWVCAGVGAGVGVGVVGDGGRVAVVLWVPCVCAGPQASGSQGAGPGGADGGWLATVVAWRLRGWLRLLLSVWVAWPGVGVRVGVFMAWADGVVGSVGVVGLCGSRVCVRRRRSGWGWGTVGDAMGGGDAGDAYGGVL